MNTHNIQILQRKLDYTFKNITLLNQALTHKSASTSHYERLEFFGDSLLSVFISEYLYTHFPQCSEGELTRMRSALVNQNTLAEISQSLTLEDVLILSSGELKSGGFRRKSILSDALEAIIAAIYLDADFITCQKVVLNLFQERLIDISPNVNKDPKTKLQEYLQGNNYMRPIYNIIKTEGSDHNQIFYIECLIIDLNIATTSHGNSKRKAEQNAAEIALDLIYGK